MLYTSVPRTSVRGQTLPPVLIAPPLALPAPPKRLALPAPAATLALPAPSPRAQFLHDLARHLDKLYGELDVNYLPRYGHCFITASGATKLVIKPPESLRRPVTVAPYRRTPWETPRDEVQTYDFRIGGRALYDLLRTVINRANAQRGELHEFVQSGVSHA
jgi:hypothetical protein